MENLFRLKEIAAAGRIQEKKTPEEIERPLEASDFSEDTAAAEKAFRLIYPFCVHNISFGSESMDSVIETILLCGEHSEETLWSTKQTVFQAKSIMTSFIGRQESNLVPGKTLLEHLYKKLNKNAWKLNPASVICFRWVLKQIKILQMGECLSLTMPICLSILDDYKIENKIIALDCLQHIFFNVTYPDFNCYMDIVILKEKLKPMLYFRELGLIVPLMKCIFGIHEMTNMKISSHSGDLRWSFYDDCLNIVFPMMEGEYELERRKEYSEVLALILARAELSVSRWSTRIIRIIDDYTKTPSTEYKALLALRYFVTACWPIFKKEEESTKGIVKRGLKSEDENAKMEANKTKQLLEMILNNTSC